jgi:hypothetical protein
MSGRRLSSWREPGSAATRTGGLFPDGQPDVDDQRDGRRARRRLAHPLGPRAGRRLNRPPALDQPPGLSYIHLAPMLRYGVSKWAICRSPTARKTCMTRYVTARYRRFTMGNLPARPDGAFRLHSGRMADLPTAILPPTNPRENLRWLDVRRSARLPSLVIKWHLSPKTGVYTRPRKDEGQRCLSGLT